MTPATQRNRFRACLGALLPALALTAQTPPDPADILARARVQIADAVKRLPKYTCVQTIDRNYYMRTDSGHTLNPSCDQAAADKEKGRNPLHLAYTDRVRLEVAEGDGREIHSWPGASRFETGYIDELVKRGPIATGSFGGYLVDILQNGGAQFDFAGSGNEAGRQILRYAYRVPQEISRAWRRRAAHAASACGSAGCDDFRNRRETPCGSGGS
jgi:hypothetical protein